jgi:hypothetical protein
MLQICLLLEQEVLQRSVAAPQRLLRASNHHYEPGRCTDWVGRRGPHVDNELEARTGFSLRTGAAARVSAMICVILQALDPQVRAWY